MEKNGKTWNWCTNDCHPSPRWCQRPNCMNKADYEKKQEEDKKKTEDSSGKVNASKSFKTALMGLMKDEDYKSFCNQFLN